jgi:Flp pilus assembly protein TadD
MLRLHLFRTAILTMCLAAPVLAQTGRVGGVVKSTDGKPIKGATVKAQNPNFAPGEYTATSDDKGRWSIIGLRSGPWKFTAEAPGFDAQSGMANIRTIGAPNPPLEFTLSPGIPAGPIGLSKEVQAELKAADDLRNSGQFDQAIAAYTAVRTKNPALTMINMVVGGTYRQKAAKETDAAARQASFDHALAAYQEMLKADPNSERATVEIGMTHLQAGNVDAAAQALEPLARSAAASREVFYSLGEIKFSKGDNAAAEAMFARASEIDPSWLMPKLKLGLVAFNKGDKENAIKIFDSIVAADPNAPEAAQANAFLKELRK